jgi:hypothetical protein
VKKQKEIIAFWVVISIVLAAFFIPAVSGAVCTEASVNPGTINLGENTTVTLLVVTAEPTAGAAGAVYFVLSDNVTYAGNASIEPNSIVDNTLEWFITPEPSWTVSFDVKPENPGKQAVNVLDNPETLYNSETLYGKVTGGGCEIPIDHKKKATFGFVAQNKSGEVKGSLQFTDHAEEMKVHSESIDSDSLTFGLNNATFTGTARVDNVSGCTFEAYVEDNGEPGKDKDIFAINITGPDGFTYSAKGTLTGGNIQLHNSSGNIRSQEVFVDVRMSPVADFSWAPTEPHAGENATFTAIAFDPDGGSITNYTWDFGDGTEPVETITETVKHAFDEWRNYNVTLTVADDEGDKTTVNRTVPVSPSPAAEGITMTPPGDGVLYIGQQVYIGLNFTNGMGKSARLKVDECTIWSVESLPSNETTVIWLPMSSGKHKLGAYLNGAEYDNETVTIHIRKVK